MKHEIVLLKRAGLLPAGQGNTAIIFGVKLFGSSTKVQGVINALLCPAPSGAGRVALALPLPPAGRARPGPGQLQRARAEAGSSGGGKGRGARGQQAAPLPPQPAGSEGAPGPCVREGKAALCEAGSASPAGPRPPAAATRRRGSPEQGGFVPGARPGPASPLLRGNATGTRSWMGFVARGRAVTAKRNVSGLLAPPVKVVGGKVGPLLKAPYT